MDAGFIDWDKGPFTNTSRGDSSSGTSASKLAALSLFACTIPFGVDFSVDNESHGTSHYWSCDMGPELAPIPGSLRLPCDDQESFGIPQFVPSEIREFLNDKLSDAKAFELNRGGESPTDSCFEESRNLLETMYARFRRLPSKVVTTKSGSVYLCYRNTRNDVTLRVEVDNDLDIVATINTKNGLIESGVFEDDFADQAIAVLLGEVSAEEAFGFTR